LEDERSDIEGQTKSQLVKINNSSPQSTSKESLNDIDPQTQSPPFRLLDKIRPLTQFRTSASSNFVSTKNSSTLSASYKQSDDNCDDIIAPPSQYASLVNNKNYNSSQANNTANIYNARINSSQTSSISNENSQRQRVQFANISSPANATDNFEILQYRLNELQKSVEDLQTTSNYPTVYVSYRNFYEILTNFHLF
jgi:hypothetical protein